MIVTRNSNKQKKLKACKIKKRSNVDTSSYHWHKKPYGLFNLEFLSDYTSATIPTLEIEVYIKIIIIC